MNKLPIDKRTQIIQLLVEGTSIRATSRIADVSINTVTKLLVDIGAACQDFHNMTVINVKSQHVQCGEILSFVCPKSRNVEEAVAAPDGAGDVWTLTGVDSDTKLIVSWFVNNRDAQSAFEFVQDVKSRIANHIQLTTDGYKPYFKAVEATFESQIDFDQFVKVYGSSQGNNKLHNSAEFAVSERTIIGGRLDEKHITTPYIERLNKPLRMRMGRFMRLTNGFSKKVENHCFAIALHFVYYNFCKVHESLRVTPAMKARLTDHPMTIRQIIELIN